MSIDISIKQKGLLKKTMPLEVILGQELRYGCYEDVLRLEQDKLGENEFIAYHPKHIARGFSVAWTPHEMNQITLRALTPSTTEELRDFYDAVKRMTDYWKCTLEVDGNRISPYEFQNGFANMLDFDRRALKHFAKSVVSGEIGEQTLFSAFWPLVMGKPEAERFVNDPNAYAAWLHDKQSIDAYYAKPSFFKTEDGIVGRYALTEGTLSIFPIKPYVPFVVCDPETGKELQCNEYGIFLYSVTRDESLGVAEYNKIMQSINPAKLSRYDANHVLIEELTLKEMNAALQKATE